MGDGVILHTGQSTSGIMHAEGDILNDIEIIIGSDYRDHLFGPDTQPHESYASTGTFTFYPTITSDDITIQGGPGNDEIHSNTGNDTLYGGTGDDYLNTDKTGNNTIHPGTGDNRIYLGDGADTVVISLRPELVGLLDEIDYIQDFDPVEDKIDLAAFNLDDDYELNLSLNDSNDMALDLNDAEGGQIWFVGITDPLPDEVFIT